jgi:hypothetical protein
VKVPLPHRSAAIVKWLAPLCATVAKTLRFFAYPAFTADTSIGDARVMSTARSPLSFRPGWRIAASVYTVAGVANTALLLIAGSWAVNAGLLWWLALRPRDAGFQRGDKVPTGAAKRTR